MTAQIAAADADPFALQQPPVARRRIRRPTTIFLIVAALAYLIGLIALIPARMIQPESDSLKVGGTIWNGEAVLASTIRVEWQFAPVRSLTELGFSADFHLTGGGTDLAGNVTRSGKAMKLRQVTGQMDETMLAVLAPNLPLSCRLLADVDMRELVLGGSDQRMDGSMKISPATCMAKGTAGPQAQLPASTFAATPGPTSSLGAVTSAATRERLFELRLSRDGAFSLWPTAAAVQQVPLFAGLRYDTRID